MHDGEEIFETLSAPCRSRDLSMDFEAALAKLPDGAREIFVLHDVEGYKHHEIGTLLEISSRHVEGAAAPRAHDAAAASERASAERE